MIPHDHIAIDGDRAWLVFTDNWRSDVAFQWDMLDRPCDTCGGKQRYDVTENGRYIGWQYCTDCNTGRHTFAVEVEEHWTAYGESGTGARTLRVSVVPDMVLPIVDEQDAIDGKTIPAACVLYRVPTGEAWFFGRPQGGVRAITLPPAARPGMWAVLLEVHL